MKTEVYSWRVSSEVKTGLEREARRRKISVSAALDCAAREWLRRNAESNDDDEQHRLKKSVTRWLGALDGVDARRSENASRIVRQRLLKRYGR